MVKYNQFHKNLAYVHIAINLDISDSFLCVWKLMFVFWIACDSMKLKGNLKNVC